MARSGCSCSWSWYGLAGAAYGWRPVPHTKRKGVQSGTSTTAAMQHPNQHHQFEVKLSTLSAITSARRVQSSRAIQCYLHSFDLKRGKGALERKMRKERKDELEGIV